jgi:hypothetical protein
MLLRAQPGAAREEIHAFMKSPLTTTLFTQHNDFRRPPTTFVMSLVVHTGLLCLIFFGVFYTPPILVRTSLDHYSVRHLDLDMPIEPPRYAPKNNIAYPGQHRPSPSTQASNGAQAERSLVMPPVPHAMRSPQTLIQPDVHPDITLTQEAPLPQIALWTPAKMPVTNIVAPLPAKPPTLELKPRLTQPNQEPNLGNIAISSVPQPALNQLLSPSNTTPIVVKGPPQPAPAVATVTQKTAVPTPAAVISLSDVKLKNGSVTLPPVNEAAAANTNEAASPMPGPAKPVPTTGNGEAGSKGEGNGPGKAEGTHAGDVAGNAPAPGSSSKFTVTGADQPQGATNGTGDGDELSVTAISLPKDGNFSSVIVGNSLQDQYPEISDVWQGRVAYTVYLHVGLEKSWILQYTLPRAAEVAGAGSIIHLEAPWPYSIVRPNLPPDAITTDALLIHGFVNNAGRFETLSIVFPTQFPQAQFVLQSLERWQFRPASQNGQIAKVEVLLIIPEQFE